MNLKLAFAAALFLAAAPGAALARDVVTAKLAAPVAEREQVVAATLVWTCEGDSCVAVSRSRAGLRVCRDLAKEVGRITAFSAEGEAALNSDDLEACNARARVRTASN